MAQISPPTFHHKQQQELQQLTHHQQHHKHHHHKHHPPPSPEEADPFAKASNTCSDSCAVEAKSTSTINLPFILSPAAKRVKRERKPESDAKREREVVAVDFDETLAVTHDAIIEFHNLRYGTTHKPDEFESYSYAEASANSFNKWGCTRQECTQRVVSFMQSDEWHKLIKPIPDALLVLKVLLITFSHLPSVMHHLNTILLQNDKTNQKALSQHFKFILVTSRPSCVEMNTRRFLDHHYPDVFEEVVFVGGPGPNPPVITPMQTHFPSPPPASPTDSEKIQCRKRSKADACKEFGATVLVDDSLENVMDCKKNGMDVLLFDLDGMYSWNKGCDFGNDDGGEGSEGGRRGVGRRVKSWREVKEALRERLPGLAGDGDGDGNADDDAAVVVVEKKMKVKDGFSSSPKY
ncbi:hypothetical protein HDU97_002278 [Phlyctochytrium planicorne]|nr:hypothetical protein HDU97_002278 [Phlyctochytrium planicorne]